MLKNKESDEERIAMAGRLASFLSASGAKTRAANVCGVTDQAVTGWLKTGRISKNHIPKLVDEFGVDINWLLTGQGEKYPSRQIATHQNSLENDPQTQAEAIRALLAMSTPQGASVLNELARIAAERGLEEADIKVLEAIKDRYKPRKG